MSVLMRPWGHMNFRDIGPRDGLPVVFANSLGTDLRMWDGVIAALPGLRAIGFDKRGHGLSALPPQAWTIEDLASDVLALMDHLQIDRAVIAGCSVGGMIAQATAIAAPGRVRGLVLSNTAAKIGTVEGWQARIAAIRAGGIASIGDAILQRWFAADFLARPDHLAWRTMLERTDPEGYCGTCVVLSKADLRAGLRGLDMPVLFLAGDQDQSTPVSLVTETAALIAGAKVAVVGGSGHLPAIDAPATTAKLIEDFLKDHFHD